MSIENTLARLVYEAVVAEIDKQADKLKAQVAKALGVS